MNATRAGSPVEEGAGDLRIALPNCCAAVAVELVSSLHAVTSPAARPDDVSEHLLEVSARAALYRWLSHCRAHRRERWAQAVAA